MQTRPIAGEGQAGMPPPPVREILVPTDLSDGFAAALAQAAGLATRLGSRVTIYHALEFLDHEDPHWAFGKRAAVWNEEERLARDHLAGATQDLAVPHEEIVERAASPVLALLHRIEATRPDLTVMATRSRGAIEHALLGSVTEQVVGHCRTPVLCLRGAASLDLQLAGRIVLASDLSLKGRAALQMASLLAGAFGGELVVVHTPARRAFVPWGTHRSDAGLTRAAAARWLEPVPPGVRVRFEVADTLAANVLRVASRENAGLVVVSRRTRGSGPPHEGGPARVVRSAHCSVLVV